MDFWTRKEAALALLANSSLSRSEYAPPLYRMLWRWRVPIRPPHFQTFGRRLLIQGGFFGFFFGTIMWLVPWFGPKSVAGGVAMMLIAGVVFGLAVATILSRRWHALRLPTWEAIRVVDTAEVQEP